jgi:type II secretory pathway pseudopilin PulG
MLVCTKRRDALSSIELLAVLAILGIVVTVMLPRAASDSDAAKIAICHVNQGNIEIQAERWRHNTGTWPASNLSAIGANAEYFPEGVPLCPVDGSSYTIDTNGRVVGHNH